MCALCDWVLVAEPLLEITQWMTEFVTLRYISDVSAAKRTKIFSIKVL